MESEIKDPSLADKGKLTIEWTERHMPVLNLIKKRFQEDKPLKGYRVAACLHVTKETAVLMKALKAAGAEVALCASNPLSTQDDVAAALVEEGVNVFAWRGESKEDYYRLINKVLDFQPNVTLDDGGDLVNTVHSSRRELLPNIIGGCEETTTGVIRLRMMAKDKVLKYPMIAVNDTPTKWDFDNVYGTGQSSIDGILRATSVLLAGKNFVVAGYGHCGRGVALRARGMGAHVIVTEIDPVKALRALMDGYRVMTMEEAAKIGDIFITATGNTSVIRIEHIERMKDGAIVCNTGHFNVEIDIQDLEKAAKRKRHIRPNVDEYLLPNNKRIYLLAEGRLVNLAAAEGHPSEVMDMSFSDQALSVEYIIKHGRELKPDVYNVPVEIDEQVARLKLESLNVKIDRLTEKQIAYLSSYHLGTE
ncbi:MAG: adenosylhomocysteinase [Candidatus Odinarchaeum yellowstonii]|uniref:Adenosylhomocysteinase n=1 Tax=Odinarchaeota yellowstonii (strain LCB_4) TaxID=1841599 RepID=A0AAF0IBS4_ODILC|nr:MAG: adenosylhomocysteinase [Candidatus Odinarchaeum yellowstonii]